MNLVIRRLTCSLVIWGFLPSDRGPAPMSELACQDRRGLLWHGCRPVTACCACRSLGDLQGGSGVVGRPLEGEEASMEFRILGPVEARNADETVALGSEKQRSLLAILLLHANEVVSAEQLIDGLWGSGPHRPRYGPCRHTSRGYARR